MLRRRFTPTVSTPADSEATPPAPPRQPLRRADRCDACGAQAWVEAALPYGETPLLFCAHHFRKHEAALLAQGATIYDERERLYAEVYASRAPEPDDE